MTLVPELAAGTSASALSFPDGALSYAQLARAVAGLRARLPGDGRVALWAAPELGTAIGLLAGLEAGLDVVPLNPKSGPGELAHILAETRPSALIAPAGTAFEDIPETWFCPVCGARKRDFAPYEEE